MSRQPPKVSAYVNGYTEKDEALVAAHPPQITWRKGKHGIWVAAKVVETPTRANASRPPVSSRSPRCRYGHRLTPDNVDVTRAGYRRCLTCKADKQERRDAQRRALEAAVEAMALQPMEVDAAEVAERFRKHRAANTPLMQSARTDI